MKGKSQSHLICYKPAEERLHGQLPSLPQKDQHGTEDNGGATIDTPTAAFRVVGTDPQVISALQVRINSETKWLLLVYR